MFHNFNQQVFKWFQTLQLSVSTISYGLHFFLVKRCEITILKENLLLQTTRVLIFEEKKTPRCVNMKIFIAVFNCWRLRTNHNCFYFIWLVKGQSNKIQMIFLPAGQLRVILKNHNLFYLSTCCTWGNLKHVCLSLPERDFIVRHKLGFFPELVIMSSVASLFAVIATCV